MRVVESEFCMGDFRRIEVSHWESGKKRISVVEVLDEKLAGPTMVQELATELLRMLEQSEKKDVLLNLGRVEFIASAALNRLINFQKRVHSDGGKLKLCSLRPSIETIFATTRLNQVFDIQRTEAEALASY